MKCKCDKNCIKDKETTLNNIDERYEPCEKCEKSKLKKAIPIKKQLKSDNINKNYKRCLECNKRHIDVVIAHVLKIMIKEGQIPETSALRHVGTPLITPAIPLTHPPYLPENSLTIISNSIDKHTAELIQNEVPEIKAIIKGDTTKTVGQLKATDKPHNYELLTGCDIRCDIQNTPTGQICIYKPQSKIHIEYPQIEPPKVMELDKVLNNYDNPTLIDATCGPGTLGIYALTKNAKKVIFNDIYSVALDTTRINLKVNGITEDRYELYNKNIEELSENITKMYDIGIIDVFPGIDTKPFIQSLEKICKEIIII